MRFRAEKDIFLYLFIFLEFVFQMSIKSTLSCVDLVELVFSESRHIFLISYTDITKTQSGVAWAVTYVCVCVSVFCVSVDESINCARTRVSQ